MTRGRSVVDFGVLGPVEVRNGGRPVPVGGSRERLVLAMLLLRADRVVAKDRLIDALWEDPPASAKAQLHNTISKLRGQLAADELIVTRPVGYELRLDSHRLDLLYTPLTTDPVAWASGLILPWITLAFLSSAIYARLTRAGMLDTLGEDFIRTARAKGLRERTVIGKHALRASLTPILTVFGMDVGLLLGGAILTEKTFSLKGIGQAALDGVTQSDLPMVLGVVLFAALFIVLANLIVDVLYGVLDPTARHAQ